MLHPGTEVRAKWKVVVERDAIWVMFDLSVVRKALLTVTSANPLTTEAEDDSEVPSVLMACRNSPFFLAILFCLLQSSD